MSEFDRMVQFLDKAYCLKDQIVPCLIGPVGIGKTAAVRQHAKNVGANVVTIIASQILPSEVSGITMPDEKTKSMEIYDHYRLGHMKDGDILFFDELLEADQCVLSACLTLIESRMLMSGKRLPDIQIIAACNPTVQAGAIKESIRQRFMFMEFKLDKDQVAEYIKNATGIVLSKEVLDKLAITGNDYNILSPRSLTKLCSWLAKDPCIEVQTHINDMWGGDLGNKIMQCYVNSNRKTPANQVREKIAELAPELDDELKDCTFSELMEALQNLENFDEIIKQLESIEIDEPEEVEAVYN